MALVRDWENYEAMGVKIRVDAETVTKNKTVRKALLYNIINNTPVVFVVLSHHERTITQTQN